MTEIDLIYETSQITDIDPSVLIKNAILYLYIEYKVKNITDRKIAIEYDFSSSNGLFRMSNSKRFRTILYGQLEIIDSRIIFSYEIDILGLLLPLIIGILISLANPWVLILPVPFILQEWFKIVILKNESQRILKAITNNTDQPITTKFKTMRID